MPQPAAPPVAPVALVTGAAGGIGAAVVTALSERGIPVAAVDLPSERSAALVSARGTPNGTGEIRPYELDVTDPSQVAVVVEEIETGFGPIGYLANVAGVLSCAPVLADGPDWLVEWHRMFAVNATGPMLVSRAVASRMIGRGRGSIVTVGSNAGTVPRTGMAAYCASKAAARLFTQVLGLELAGSGVRANVVSPGSTDTPMLAELAGGHQSLVQGNPAEFKLGIPLGRVAEPGAIADAVVFLLSDAARHITLHDLRVDGGATLGG